jgi:peptide methionine sulfoxide reductase msrA/msrB
MSITKESRIPAAGAALVVASALLLTACSNNDAPPTATTSPTWDRATESNDMVRVHVFNEAGQLVGPVDTPKIEKSDEEWRMLLTPEQYRITRNAGTEAPFCGTLLDNKREGVYACVACGLPLFSSDAKFTSGTGWPSYFKPIAAGNVAEKQDRSHFMVRTEVLCGRCDSHLGHVFDDGPRPTGLRYCLNSESLTFVDKAELAKLADPAAKQANGQDVAKGDADDKTTADTAAAQDAQNTQPASDAPKLANAVLAGGCFWCTEAVFEPLDGVIDVVSGYAGDTKETANYETVVTGRTKHAEAIRITYDPSKISYEKLLEIFFTVAHDPTTLNRQGNDTGPQYRSAVFYANDEEKKLAQDYIRKLASSGHYDKPIVTTLEPLEAFYVAEQYHQDYARQNPNNPYIYFQALPKVEKLKEKYGEELKGAGRE